MLVAATKYAINEMQQPVREEKVWQGHAFDAEEIHNNSPKMIYFEFLKLRGLFDPDTENEVDWPQHIQDAILEKLGSNIRVLHLAVDMRSKDGCVYLKMGSAQEALDAFKILNGSWFSNRLVSAKYLRPERYYERFPDAVKAYIPLSIKQARNSLNNRIF
uniref:RRM domain-containing protein n=1 Tax=Romanomermis culicivorax TaxID=13658 RepID=A0A915HKC7_ROMCU